MKGALRSIVAGELSAESRAVVLRVAHARLKSREAEVEELRSLVQDAEAAHAAKRPQPSQGMWAANDLAVSAVREWLRATDYNRSIGIPARLSIMMQVALAILPKDQLPDARTSGEVPQ